MKKRSAGILMFKRAGDDVYLLLVHPGGPFWARKDIGAWSIPKGEYAEPEDPLTAARREFEEETGMQLKSPVVALGELIQPNGKIVTAYATEGDFDPATLKSNLFEMEWPPRSGNRHLFPEVDRAEWFLPGDAREKILRGQIEFINRLMNSLDRPTNQVAQKK